MSTSGSDKAKMAGGAALLIIFNVLMPIAITFGIIWLGLKLFGVL